MATTKYKANASVLGLRPGDEFESNDDFYKTFADAGYLTVVSAPPASKSKAERDAEKAKQAAEQAEVDAAAAAAVDDAVEGLSGV